jgi:hypothetical protein
MCSETAHHAVTCLWHVMQDETAHSKGLWKAAFDGGLVLVLCTMLRHGDQATVVSALTLGTCLMRVTPLGLKGLEGQWASKLPRAVAGLITAKPEVAPVLAVKTLLSMCSTHRDALMDSHKRGLGYSLRLLTTHSDPETAAAAKELCSLVDQPLEVRWTPPFPRKCNCCCFPLSSPFRGVAGLGCANQPTMLANFGVNVLCIHAV